MTVIDLPPLTPSQLSQLSTLFNLLAPPSSNPSSPPSLGPSEVGFLLRSLGVPSTESEVLDLIAEVDSKGTGTMAYDEFVMLMGRGMDLEQTAQEEIDDAFRAMAGGRAARGGKAAGKGEERATGRTGAEGAAAEQGATRGGKGGMDQFVTAAALRDALNGMAEGGGELVTKEEVDEMIAEADVDGNGGKIGREDFRYMMETRHKEIDRKDRGGGKV